MMAMIDVHPSVYAPPGRMLICSTPRRMGKMDHLFDLYKKGFKVDMTSSPLTEDDGVVRKFDTGATRDTSQNKPAYGGFLSPRVLRRFGQYMSKHRVQSDGSLRDPDNWQKGIPQEVYMESLLRHVMDVWLHMRGEAELAEEADLEEALCATLFNVQGLLFEITR